MSLCQKIQSAVSSDNSRADSTDSRIIGSSGRILYNDRNEKDEIAEDTKNIKPEVKIKYYQAAQT